MIKPIQAQLSTLLVDDNSTNLKILERTLKHHFSHLIDLDSVQKASNGYEALAARAVHNFDLILLDIDMPGLSGVQVAQSVRATDGDIIIIACTTSDSPAARLIYAEAGMDGCVSKPLDLREVNNALIQALRSRKDLNLYHEIGSSELLDRYLVHRGSLPSVTIASSRKHLLAPRSVSSSNIEKVTPFISQLTTPEEDLAISASTSEDEHEDCSSLIEESECSSDDSMVVRSRSGSMSFSKCACAGRRRMRRPRLVHAVSEDSITSLESAQDRILAAAP